MSTLTGKDLNLVKPALTDDHKVTIGTDLPANFQKIDDEFSTHLADTAPHSTYVVQKSGSTMTGSLVISTNKELDLTGSNAMGVTQGFIKMYAPGHSGAYAGIEGITEGDGINVTAMKFYTAYGAAAEAMRIESHGRVGIGNNNPQYILDVNHATSKINSKNGYLTNGADFGEYFESADGQSIPYGISVVLVNEKIRPALAGEIPIGVISATCAWIGNAGSTEWTKKYQRNAMGDLILNEVTKTEKIQRQKTEVKMVAATEIQLINGKYTQVEISQEQEVPVFDTFDLYGSDGKVVGQYQIPVMETETVTITVKEPVLNPAYDPSQPYIRREERPEWNGVGLLGQVRIIKGQPTAPGWIKLKDISDTVELWLLK